MLSPRMIALAMLLGRKYGRPAAQALARSAQEWMADPANEEARERLVTQLRSWSTTLGGAAGRSAQALARQVERRKVTVAAWERDVMELRYELPELPDGPVREAALRAYESQVRAAVHLVGSAHRTERAREQVLAALRAEERMLAEERLPAHQRQQAIAAVQAAMAACGGAGVRRAD